MDIKGRVYKREIEEQNIQDIYDLAYEDIDNTTVVIAEQDLQEVEDVCDILDELGFALEKWNYTAVELATKKVRHAVYEKADCLVGWSTDNEKYPGYVVYGDDNETDIKILILGGSTSTDGIYRTVSWVRAFYSMLVQSGYHVTIFNGAACGHGIVAEFLRLCRDGAENYLKPDYVISLSGVNNLVRKEVKNQFCEPWLIDVRGTEAISGIEGQESLYDFWCRILGLMKLVCESYGGKFFGFLQPIYAPDRRTKLSEVSMYEMIDRVENILAFRERSKKEENLLYTNLIDFLDEEEEVYIDAAHYSSKMNRKIAKAVFDAMIEKEGSLKKREEMM